MRRLSVQTLALLLVAGGTGIAAASEPSGSAVAVIQSTQAFGHAGNRTLQASGPVYTGDQIVTGPRGQAQIIFTDNTKLVVGPNSRMKIDAFVFGGNGSAKEVSLNAVRGAFRFITGSSAKSAYKITTPTATIGVRGTEFDFNVSSSRLDLAVFNGQTRICDHRSGTCFTQGSGCSLSRSGAGGKPRVSRTPRAQLDRMFPFIRQQGNLRTAFRVDTSSCGVQRAALPPTGGQGGSSQFDFSTVGSVSSPSGSGGSVATSGGGGPGPSGGGRSAPSSGGGSALSGGGSAPSGGGGGPGPSGGGGGNSCGNCGNGVGNNGGNGTGNEGRGNGNGGNSSNAPGHSGSAPGNSGNSPGHNKP